jgi:DNA-binding GntR family transcriptional regulator
MGRLWRGPKRLPKIVHCSYTHATRLGLATGSPLLKVEGTTFDENDQPVKYFRALNFAKRCRSFT